MMIMTKEMYDEAMEKIGYVIQFTPCCNPREFHTYGMTDNFNRYELQMRINISPEDINYIMNHIAQHYIKQNIPTRTEVYQLEQLNNQKIIMKYTLDSERNVVIRAILCDKNGLFPWNEGCDPGFKVQWSDEDDQNYTNIVHLISQYGFEKVKQVR